MNYSSSIIIYTYFTRLILKISEILSVILNIPKSDSILSPYRTDTHNSEYNLPRTVVVGFEEYPDHMVDQFEGMGEVD